MQHGDTSHAQDLALISATFWMALTVAGALTGLSYSARRRPAPAALPARKPPTARSPAPPRTRASRRSCWARSTLPRRRSTCPGRLFRMRRLVIQPGGEVAWHSHEDRPALIYIIKGTIVEYSSHCSVPIVHDAGDLSVEQGGLSHWWKNTTKKPVTLDLGRHRQRPQRARHVSGRARRLPPVCGGRRPLMLDSADKWPRRRSNARTLRHGSCEHDRGSTHATLALGRVPALCWSSR